MRRSVRLVALVRLEHAGTRRPASVGTADKPKVVDHGLERAVVVARARDEVGVEVHIKNDAGYFDYFDKAGAFRRTHTASKRTSHSAWRARRIWLHGPRVAARFVVWTLDGDSK